jgi:hypothetical protein
VRSFGTLPRVSRLFSQALGIPRRGFVLRASGVPGIKL